MRIVLQIMSSLFVFAQFFGNGSAFATCNEDNCRSVFVERLFLRESGSIYVDTSGIEANLNCEAIDSRYVELPVNHGNRDSIYSMLLSAQLAEREVWLNLKPGGSTGNRCIVRYAVIDRQ